MTRDRVLLVGEDFGNSDPQYHSDVYALTGASGRRITELCGYQGGNKILQYALDFERTNVVTLQPDWKDKEMVRASVYDLLSRMVGRRTILLGSRVAEAFNLLHLGYFEWTRDPDVNLIVARAPHPSGRSHWWNDPANVESARRFWSATRASV